MEDITPCLFWPQDIGPYMTELSHLYCELKNLVKTVEALMVVRSHLEGLPNYTSADLPNLRYRAYLLVLIDLLRQDWQHMCRQGRIYLIPPSWIESVRGLEAVQTQKAAIRASLNYERLAQLKKPSVQAFIRKMERIHLFKGQPVSIFSLYASGEKLAADLLAVQDITHEKTLNETICSVIQPYLQQVIPDTRCEHTGFLMNDIWRYIRHTWSIPYNATPGRNVFYLVRDAARPFHPIIGIAALGSSLVQLTARDNVIGWTLQSTLSRIKNAQFTDADAQKIVYMLRSTLEATLADVSTDDLDVSPNELINPTEEVLSRLKTTAKEAREKRITLLQKHRSIGRQKSTDEVSDAPDQLENVTGNIQYIEQQTNYNLFKAKRAETIFWLLNAKVAIDSCSFDMESIEGMRQFISNQAGRQAVQTLIRENKKRKVGINMMDIIVCGAVPPYNFILGGKLVAMLIISPQVIYEYEQKYKHHLSDIASKMKNNTVYKDPKLVFLGTTSLYHSGSSQYNRISIPLPDGKHQMRYENYGKTLGFGSVHYSEETIEALQELQELKNDARLINNRFGEGVNPKLRRIRTGLALLGLEKSDHFLNIDAVILFADIRSFTEQSAGMIPQDIAQQLSAYFDAMVNLIHRHEGLIDKFIGDAVMAMWGFVPSEEDLAELAFACAKAMIATAAKMTFGNKPIVIGVGLNAGQVFIGNVGGEGKRQFTVLGTPVNLAARFESETKALGAPLVMGKAFYDRLLPAAQEYLIIHENHPIRGAEPQTLYTWQAARGIGEEEKR